MSLALVYAEFRDVVLVKQAMTGMSAVCAGMILATAAKMGSALKRQWKWLSIGVLAFVAVIVLHIKVAVLVMVLAPVAVGLAYWRDPK
jgi:chromate transporter